MDQLINRIKDILMTPQTAWETIKNEETAPTDLIKNYLIFLAAIPAIANFIGNALIGRNIPFIEHYRTPFFSTLLSSIVYYVALLAGIYLAAWVINYLSESFEGKKDFDAAFRVVGYSYTAVLVAGIFSMIPALAPLQLLGFYSIYLLYLGLPVLMDCPKEKAFAYTVVSIIVMIVVSVIVSGFAALFICR